jgi:hypothetical protein
MTVGRTNCPPSPGLMPHPTPPGGWRAGACPFKSIAAPEATGPGFDNGSTSPKKVLDDIPPKTERPGRHARGRACRQIQWRDIACYLSWSRHHRPPPQIAPQQRQSQRPRPLHLNLEPRIHLSKNSLTTGSIYQLHRQAKPRRTRASVPLIAQRQTGSNSICDLAVGWFRHRLVASDHDAWKTGSQFGVSSTKLLIRLKARCPRFCSLPLPSVSRLRERKFTLRFLLVKPCRRNFHPSAARLLKIRRLR